MPPRTRKQDDAAYAEAIRWFRQRVPVSDDDFDKLTERARAQSFRVAGVTQLRLVDSVMRSLDKAFANGETLAKFKQRASGVLARAWGGPHPHRVEAIYRTETQRAYMRGRYRQLTHPSTKNLRPFWIYDAVLDSSTTALCRGLNGTTLPLTDPFWKTHYPPLHHNCRSGVRALRRSDVAKRGGPTTDVPDLRPDSGFGDTPTDDGEPDISKVDQELQGIYWRKRK